MKTTLISMLLLSLPLWAQNPVLPNSTAEKAGEIGKSQNDTIADDVKGAIKKAKVYLIEPKNKATVPSKFKVKMGVDGMKVRPAGEDPDNILAGHHHLLIDSGPVPAGQPIVNDETHLHFGKGQTETEVSLKPGPHTLTLQFADGAHRSYGKDMSQTIHIQVK
jgi:hypothetical protein